jgi:hypothetical protein
VNKRGSGVIFSSTTLAAPLRGYHHRPVQTATAPYPPTRTPPDPSATLPHDRPRRPARTRRPHRPALRWLSGTPGRIRLLAASAALASVALTALLVGEVGRERGGLDGIGHRAGPEVIASADLYFALNDMDAQVANVLLVGDAQNLGFTRTQALDIFEQRRRQADRDVHQTAAAATDPATGQTVADILDALGRYEALAAQTILLDQQTAHPPGRPTAETLARYRQATDLLKDQLLPTAHRLTEQHAHALETSYQSQRSRIQTVRSGALALGLALLALLLVLQVYLARRFHRLLNPALAAATVLALTAMLLGLGLLTDEAEHLRVAKKDAFDSILALTQARAISYDANADESRYLVDPDRAGRYQQDFLDKSQQLVGLTGADLASYDKTLATAITAYRDRRDVTWNGSFGTEFRNITFTGERAAAETTLLRYQTYQLDDRRIRALVNAGRLSDAIAFCTSYHPGDSNYDFDQYDQALAALIAINTNAFNQAIADGEHELDGWTPALLTGCAVMLALTVTGVWRRLAEYR